MRLLELMDGYFKPCSNQFENVLTESSDSVEPGWRRAESPERLIQDFNFPSRSVALEFLRQLLLFEDEFNHHGMVMINNTHVRIEISTHDINTITELDTEYASVADQIYFDVNFHE